jgi:short-subunit dehydrogenase
VFGTLKVLRAVLPHLRQQRRGHTINFFSVDGFIGIPGSGVYNASEFAVEGLSEALTGVLKRLGIHVTIVEPSPFPLPLRSRARSSQVFEVIKQLF